MEARALLDNASSASFVTERLVQTLCIPHVHQNVRMSGIAGSTPKSPIQSIASLQISAARPDGRKIDLTAIVVPRVTCDLPLYPVPLGLDWKHVTDLSLADPQFGQPGRIDILLGVNVFTDVLLHGRRNRPPGSPVAFETEFGWVLSGSTDGGASQEQVNLQATAFHACAGSGDDILHKFWELEESPSNASVDECIVVRHFEENHHGTGGGRLSYHYRGKLTQGRWGSLDHRLYGDSCLWNAL